MVEGAEEAADAREAVVLAMPDARPRKVEAESELLDAREVEMALEVLATMGTMEEDATTAAVAAMGAAAAGVVAAAGDAAAAAGVLGAAAAAAVRDHRQSRVSRQHERLPLTWYAPEVPETTRDLLSKVGIGTRLLGSYGGCGIVDSDSDLRVGILRLERVHVRQDLYRPCEYERRVGIRIGTYVGGRHVVRGTEGSTSSVVTCEFTLSARVLGEYVREETHQGHQ